MADPLSVAASIAGLISITVEAVKFLSPYVSASKRTPHIAAHVYSEVQSTQVILIGLQNLTKNLGSIKAQHAALIGVNQVIAILTDGVLLYSELQNELRSLPGQEDIDERLTLRGRLLWARKESTFVTLLQRLQSFKSSTSLVLMILQSDSDQSAKQHQEQLCNNVQALLESNNALARRLMNLEDSLDFRSTVLRRTSFLSPLTPSDPHTSSRRLSTETSLRIPTLAFETALRASRVYRRAKRYSMDFSFRSSVARSRNWSILSGLSLSDISNISVVALPIHRDDLTNAQDYDFGDDIPVGEELHRPPIDWPLLVQCLEIKLMMLQIRGMQKHFDEVPDPPDVFFHLWAVLPRVKPILLLLRALGVETSISVDPRQELSVNAKKDVILRLAQYCIEILDMDPRDLFTFDDLIGGDYCGLIRVISILSTLVKKLQSSSYHYPKHTLSIAQDLIDANSTGLRSLVSSQRQYVRRIVELVEIKDQLETYIEGIFPNLRHSANVHIMLLVLMERNLFHPPAEHRWFVAFDYLYTNTKAEAGLVVDDLINRFWITDLIRSGDFEDATSLLLRCREIMPVRDDRMSAYTNFHKVFVPAISLRSTHTNSIKYLQNQPIISRTQHQDSLDATSRLEAFLKKLERMTELDI
ncbi:hypothetical protein FOIG_12700 [Fusarium odoratissimum NRRL 54006]|uniref:Cdc24/Scd1 N-terminal domain-containing protein n=1 Tax=Fusarium odoratissimum (strain NRRL 54006) TaxID=1089451 RepID=X0JDT8_FUSO5|nr:uncharacterized protein FOIG_12700 [Fusarium odoratissimum NRRL 54006]EXL94505.1 hypothetical protein FOIG_12700 [Fusarium odoratissimum NRRL 54006]